MRRILIYANPAKAGGGVYLESQRVTIVLIATQGIKFLLTVPIQMTDSVRSAPLEPMKLEKTLSPVLRAQVVLPGAKKVQVNALIVWYVSQVITKM